MKKKRGLFVAFVPLMLTLSMFIVFYDSIETKPSDAGFYFILSLGMGLGIAINRFVWWIRYNKLLKESSEKSE